MTTLFDIARGLATLYASGDSYILLPRDTTTTPTLTFIVFQYVPNKIAAGVFTLLAFILAFFSFKRIVHYRSYWGLCLTIGAIGLGLGFVARILLISHQDSQSLIIASQILIICSPAAFLAFNYTAFGRLVTNCIGEEYSLIRPTRVAPLFVISDILTFLIQSGGASMGVKPEQAELGNKIFIGGVVFQWLSYVAFIGLSVSTHIRVKRADPGQLAPINKLMWAMHFSSVFILIRCTYRSIEGIQGHGYLMTHEVFFYVLDAAPLMLAMFVYIIPNLWPGSFSTGQYARQAGGDAYRMDARANKQGVPSSSRQYGA